MQTMLAHAREALQAVDAPAASLCPRRAARRALLALVAGPDRLVRVPLPETGYRRFLLFKGLHRPLSAWAFLWAPGAATPVHDHRCWCVAGVVSGRLTEERYAVLPDGSGRHGGTAVPLARVRLDAGMVTSLEAGPRGVHRILNESGSPALTVHVYGFDPAEAFSSIDRSYRIEAGAPGTGVVARSEFCRRAARE
jgi:predicted metal-dependent enzyme (double-stranded beta helix superfamily)